VAVVGGGTVVSASALIVAHAGHWLAGLLYLAPVLIVVGALVFQSYKDRRLGDDEDGAGPRPDPDGDTPHAST
jgi:hypothetical protein